MRLRFLRAVIPALLCAIRVCASLSGQRDITVEDSIEMTRWADADYLLGADPESNIASFSPDGKRFVIVLRKADLAKNANVYSICLFTTGRAFDSEVPQVLVRMSTTSNAPAIRGVKWLKDSQSVGFIGIREPGPSEVYTLSVGTRRLVQRVNSPSRSRFPACRSSASPPTRGNKLSHAQVRTALKSW